MQQARHSDLPYAPLCEDRLYLRNAVAGTYTHLERVTNFLRDHVWGGEQIVGFVKQEFFADAFVEKGGAGRPPRWSRRASAGLRAAQIGAAFGRQAVLPEVSESMSGQGSSASAARDAGMRCAMSPGYYVSVIKPQAIETAHSTRGKAQRERTRLGRGGRIGLHGGHGSSAV